MTVRKSVHGSGVARLSERQHGVIATRQLVGLGLNRGAIRNRVAQGRLRRLHLEGSTQSAVA